MLGSCILKSGTADEHEHMEVRFMKYEKYICEVCGWEYDEAEGYPDSGVAPGTKWEDVPADFVCPGCGVGKDQFSKVE